VIYGPSGQRICYFVIDSAGQPVDGLAGAVQWRLFRNGAEVFDSVTVTGLGGGLYKAVYTPSSYGQDSLILMVPSVGFYYKDETVEEALYTVTTIRRLTPCGFWSRIRKISASAFTAPKHGLPAFRRAITAWPNVM